jgi:hypothetical protein
MAVKRFSGTFKTRTDVFDNITPNNIVVTPSGGIAVPAGEFKPANWLPIAWQGSASQDYFVISSGKVVGLTSEGHIYPAGIKKTATAAATGGTVITYTASDVTAGTIDIRTGQAVTAAGAVTLTQIASGLFERGLVRADRFVKLNGGTDYNAATAAHNRIVVNEFLSEPVGVCAYDVYAWAGDAYDAEGGLNFVNYQKQHLVQFFTQAQMQMPVGGITQSSAVDLAGATAWNTGTGHHGAIWPTPDDVNVHLFLTSAQLSGLERYDDSTKPTWYVASGDPIMGFAVKTDDEGGRLAAHTSRTPTADANSVLANRKTSVADLTSSGDYLVDHNAGMILVYSSWSSTGATLSGMSATSFKYYYYDQASGASSSWQQVSAIGDLEPGDYVTYDEYSNFCRHDVGSEGIRAADGLPEGLSSSAATAETEIVRTIGRVIAIKEEPLGLLDRVRTAFDGSSFGASMQMPGSATSGYTDLLTLSNETVSNKVAIINVSFV